MRLSPYFPVHSTIANTPRMVRLITGTFLTFTYIRKGYKGIVSMMCDLSLEGKESRSINPSI